jgi:hypothetical protein
MEIQSISNPPPPADAIGKLVVTLLTELARDIPEDIQLEGVRSDMLAAAACFGQGRQQEFALRVYLVFRTFLYQWERSGQSRQIPPTEAAPVSLWPNQP